MLFINNPILFYSAVKLYLALPYIFVGLVNVGMQVSSSNLLHISQLVKEPPIAATTIHANHID